MRKLKISVGIYKFDGENNCIEIERILGDAGDFLDEYNKIKEFINEEL